MKDMINPINSAIIKQELKEKYLIKNTRRSNNEIYIFDYQAAPNTIREIGRLRELTFRDAGGGTGNACDIDEFDINPNQYQQLIIWDPKKNTIIGGYRFRTFIKQEKINLSQLATATIYNISDDFLVNYVPYLVDLGRAFIQPAYQARNQSRGSLFALDNLWDGLATLITPNIKYFFGRIVIYSSMHKMVRDSIFYFFNKHFYKNNDLVIPKKQIQIKSNKEDLESFFIYDNYIEDYKVLNQIAQDKNERIPPLISAYMNLSPSMQSFGVTIDHTFGHVYEVCILITIADIYPKVLNRYIS